MAAGAVAGAAAGLYLGRRYRSFDAFMADVRDRLGDLRTIWNSDELAAVARGERIADALDDFETDVVDDEVDDGDEDDFDDGAGYREAYADFEDDDVDGDEIDDEDLDDDDDDLGDDDDVDEVDEVDELEEELAAVTNGAIPASRAADKARKLEERVLDGLHDDDVLSERAIEIAVVGDGVVELTGTVHAIEEVSRASAMVRGVPGVSMVLNRLDVRSGGSMDTASVPREPVDSDRPPPNS
jgi:hypothetical protein